VPVRNDSVGVRVSRPRQLTSISFAGSTNPQPLLQAENLEQEFGGTQEPARVLRGVNITVDRGEFVAIMGASGSGKSTLLHALGGLESPSAGRVIFDGQVLAELSDHDLTLLRRRRIGFVFQSFNLLPLLTVRENILLPLLIDDRSLSAHGKMLDILGRLLGLEQIMARRPGELSGGQRQHVAIARALLTEPDLILADEPTGSLDHAGGVVVLDYLWSGCAHLGRTVVMVTHEAKAAIYADRVLVLQDGVVAAEISLGRNKARNDARTLVARLQELGL
jgi:putative ABC transport system ATP-binding protein